MAKILLRTVERSLEGPAMTLIVLYRGYNLDGVKIVIAIVNAAKIPLISNLLY